MTPAPPAPAPLAPAPLDWSRAHRTPIQLRYSDTDMMGHINNAAYAQFLETARIECLEVLWPEGGKAGLTLVLAHLSINYRREVRLGQQVVTELLPLRVGESSWTYAFRILAGEVPSADGETVQVHLDPAARRPAPLPPTFRTRLTGWLERGALTGTPQEVAGA